MTNPAPESIAAKVARADARSAGVQVCHHESTGTVDNVELYIRHLGESELMDSSVVTMMHGVRGFFRFAHIDGLISADPAVPARLPKVQRHESRTQGLDRLQLIRFPQVAQTIAVHHGALAYLLGIHALRASEAAAVRIEDYANTLRGHRVLHVVGKGNKPATMPLTVPVLKVPEACRGQRTSRALVLRPVSGKPIDRSTAYRMVARIAQTAQIPRHISMLARTFIRPLPPKARYVRRRASLALSIPSSTCPWPCRASLRPSP